jgi:hypothetical protein
MQISRIWLIISFRGWPSRVWGSGDPGDIVNCHGGVSGKGSFLHPGGHISSFLRLRTGNLSQALSPRKKHPTQTAEVEETDNQKQERETKPQTAAIPVGSGDAEALS